MKNIAVDMPAEARPSPSPAGKLVLIAVFAAAIVAFFYFDLKQYVSLEALKENRDRLLAFTEANYTAAVLVYILLYCLQTTFSLPGAAVFTLAGGFLFGPWLGALYVNIGATSGATLAFLAARYLFRDWVERKFGDRLGPIQEGFAKNAFSYLLTLRLIPIFPFFLVNLVSGLTRIKIGTYVAATAIGIVPGSFIYANAGRQLGSIDAPSEIASPHVLGAFALLGLLALAPIAYRKLSRKPA
ncbi:MAG: TVP38/TMEM64 family protein [Nitrospiraceae bacterium]